MTPFVSVIIPHKNDSERLELCLKALYKQTYPRDKYEIIVIDNASDKFHLGKIKSLACNRNFIMLSEPKLSSYAARNLGLKNAKGDYLAFTDSDCIPERDWIENAINEFNNNNHKQIIGGKIELFYQDLDNPKTVELYEKIHSFRQNDFIKNYNYAATANLFTSLNIINNVGYFNENLVSNGDIEWCLRANKMGYDLSYGKNIKVRHPARYSFKDFIKRQIRLCGGGFYRRKENGVSSFTLFVTNLFYMIPPVVTIYRVLKHEDFMNTRGILRKVKLIILMIFVRYLKVIETFRLLAGYEPKNY